MRDSGAGGVFNFDFLCSWLGEKEVLPASQPLERNKDTGGNMEHSTREHQGAPVSL